MSQQHRKRGLIETVMHYRAIMLLLITLLVGFGIFSLVKMPKNEFPAFTIRQGVVVGVFPGATSQEVAQQLTKPLEKFLWEFKEIKKAKTYSQSKDGMCLIFVELDDNLNNKDEFWSKFKLRLSQFKMSLPQGVLALIANDDFGDTAAMLITLESTTKTYKQLHTYADQLQDALRQIPAVSKLTIKGEQQEQIGVYINRDKLSQYGINATTLLFNLSAKGMTVPSGHLDDQRMKRPLYVSSQLNTAYDVSQQIVFTGPLGQVVRLKDIAQIRREYPTPTAYVHNNGTKALVLAIEMREGNNIVAFGNTVRQAIEDYQQTLPRDVQIYPITDQGKVVNTSIMDFLTELLIAVIAVILVIMLLLPMRVAGVAAATIPISIFISLGLFYSLGIELNTVTLAALIVTLGMIVDNSIVIIDCYIEYIDEGMSRWHAASRSAREFFGAIFSATLAISITFFPLLITMKGMFFDFVKWFPYSVTVVLLTSLIVAVFLIPYLQYAFIKKGIKGTPGVRRRKTLLDYIQRYYNILIFHCFRHPFIVLGLGLACIVLGAVLFAVQPQRLMPYADRDQFAVEIYLPTGSSITRTAAVADSLQHLLSQDKRIKNITTFYGSGSPRFQTSYAPQVGGSNYAQFIVNTVSPQATVDLLDAYSTYYTDYFPDASIRFKQLDYSTASSPVEFRFTGGTLSQLQSLTDTALAVLHRRSDLSLVRTSMQTPMPALQVMLQTDEAARLGVNKTLTSLNLAMRFGTGVPLTTLWEGDYAVPVVLKDVQAGHQQVHDLLQTSVMSPIPGISAPLRQVAHVVPTWQVGQIQHRNGMLEASVMADPIRGVNLNKVIDATYAQLLAAIELPPGIKLSIGGQRELDRETQPQIIGGLIIAIFVIFCILIFHFRDIRLSLLIMASLLFSLLGAAIGVILMGQSVSMTSTLGLISLMGIIVRNGIIMIDYAEELRVKHRISAKHAALQAAIRRMRPIFLTSAAASVGVVPMVIANTPMWGPMGSVVCFGTIISMLFIITMIPIGYWLIFRLEDHRRILKNEKKRNTLMTEKIAAQLGILLLVSILTLSPQPAQAQPHTPTPAPVQPLLPRATPYTLTRQTCYDLALRHNYALRTDSLQMRSAAVLSQEAAAYYLPTVSAQAAYFRTGDNLISHELSISGATQQALAQTLSSAGIDPAVLAGMPTSFSLGLLDRGLVAQVMALQPIYAGGRITASNALARINAEAKVLQHALTIEQVLARTDGYYNQLVGLYAKQRTLDLTDSLLARFHQDALNAYEAGLRNKGDVLTVTLKQNELAAARLRLQGGIKLVRMLLAQYIGAPTDTFTLDTALPSLLPPADDYLVSHTNALTRLAETHLLDKRIDAAHWQVRQAWGHVLPSAAVGIAGIYTNLDSGHLYDRVNVVGLATVQIPISAWWSSGKEIKRKRFAETEAKLKKQESSELLLVNMQSKYNDLQLAHQQITIAQQAEETAQENLRLHTDYYAAGTVTMSQLLQAQTQMAAARDQYTDAVLQYLNARTAYLQATAQPLTLGLPLGQ